MKDSDVILNAITEAQTTAAFAVILPVFMHGNFYSEDAIDEWAMFKPLADAFASQSAPLNAYTSPLQFANWLLLHTEIQGSRKYVDHMVKLANIRAYQKATSLSGVATLATAEKALNTAGVVLPGRTIEE